MLRPEWFKTADECVDWLRSFPFEDALNEALDFRSDDFGHDCSLLLEAESQCLTYFGEQFLERLAAERARTEKAEARVLELLEESSKRMESAVDHEVKLSKAIEALRFYANAFHVVSPNEDCTKETHVFGSMIDKPGKRARQCLKDLGVE